MQGDKFASSKPKENHISIIIMESGCWFVIWFINTLSFMVNWSQNNINCNKLKGTKICMYIIWNCDTIWTVIAIGYKECVLLKLKKKQKKTTWYPKLEPYSVEVDTPALTWDLHFQTPVSQRQEEFVWKMLKGSKILLTSNLFPFKFCLKIFFHVTPFAKCLFL